MIVYRFENGAGRGPYRGASMWQDLIDAIRLKYDRIGIAIKDPHSNPTPFNDPLLREQNYHAYPNHYFGFSSIEQAIEWFPVVEFVEAMYNRSNLRFKAFQAHDIIMGEKQVMFHKATSILEKEYTLDEMYEIYQKKALTKLPGITITMV